MIVQYIAEVTQVRKRYFKTAVGHDCFEELGRINAYPEDIACAGVVRYYLASLFAGVICPFKVSIFM